MNSALNSKCFQFLKQKREQNKKINFYIYFNVSSEFLYNNNLHVFCEERGWAYSALEGVHV